MSRMTMSRVRVALFALLLATPGALAGARALQSRERAPLRVDVDLDGDGRADRVELARHGDGQWLDALVADGGGWRWVSTTRVTDGTSENLSLALDVGARPEVRLLLTNRAGRIVSWTFDGSAFEAEAR